MCGANILQQTLIIIVTAKMLIIYVMEIIANSDAVDLQLEFINLQFVDGSELTVGCI